VHEAAHFILERALSPNPRKGRYLLREPLIAVVDDDEGFRSALVESLGSLGYEAREFSSAEDFVTWEVSASCDCVITDVHMPGMSGLDLVRLLTARGRRLPVVMVTARSGLGIDADAAASGAICLLRKPFETDALIDCLEKALKV
jgi:FixJ family two-component response regulator